MVEGLKVGLIKLLSHFIVFFYQVNCNHTFEKVNENKIKQAIFCVASHADILKGS